MVKKIPRGRKGTKDRLYARRHEKELEAAVDVDTGERFQITVLPNDAGPTKKLAPMVEDNLKTLKAPVAGEVKKKLVAKRIRYAAMRTHQEIAAMVIAAGGNSSLAARKTGLSRRQIRKYMESADFRERVAELQELLGNRIRGRVMKEVERRTSPSVIKKMELLDLLRVGDRFGLGRGNGNTIINQDNRQVNNYEANFNALFHAENSEQLLDSEEEGADFPEFEPTSLALSGGDSQE